VPLVVSLVVVLVVVSALVDVLGSSVVIDVDELVLVLVLVDVSLVVESVVPLGSVASLVALVELVEPVVAPPSSPPLHPPIINAAPATNAPKEEIFAIKPTSHPFQAQVSRDPRPRARSRRSFNLSHRACIRSPQRNHGGIRSSAISDSIV
jgi:hypothetical protein